MGERERGGGGLRMVVSDIKGDSGRGWNGWIGHVANNASSTRTQLGGHRGWGSHVLHPDPMRMIVRMRERKRERDCEGAMSGVDPVEGRTGHHAV